MIVQEDLMKRTTLLTVLSTVLFAASCTLGGLDTVQVARELSPAVAVLSAMEAAMALPVDPNEASKALDPSDSGVGLNIKPAQLYEAERIATGKNVGDIIRYPRATNTYFDDFYNAAGTQAYMEIKYDAVDTYHIWLHIFPRLDMTTTEVIEEYLVFDSLATPTNWGYYNASGVANSYISLKTILSDGTIANRTTNVLSTGMAYTAIDVPVFSTDISPYFYAANPPEFSTESGNYGSKTTSNYTADTGGVRMDIVEYYTEIGSEASGIQYFVKGKRNSRSIKDWGVTRSKTDLSTGAKTTRTLVTTGDSTSKWFTSAQEISVLETSNLLTYNSVYKESWVAPDNFNIVSPELETRIKLTETGIDSYSFQGSYETYTGSSTDGTSATLSYEPSASGYSMTIGDSVPTTGQRSLLNGDSAFTLNRSNGSYELTFQTANGSFTGTYVQGYLIGTFTSGSKSVAAEISRDSITVDGTDYSREDYLMELP